MLRSKRGDVQFLVVLIIVLTSFMLIAGTVFRFMSSAEGKQAEALCKDSVALRMAAAIQADDSEIKGAPVLCKTLDKEISGSKAEVQSQIAQSMSRCWEMMGEGRYSGDIFRNLPLWEKKENKCFTCYSIIVKDIEDEETISPQEFEQYLRETPHHKQKSLTYLQYFQYGGGNGRIIGTFHKDEQNQVHGIEAGRAYAIIFKAKAEECGAFCTKLGLAGVGAGAGGALFMAIGTGGTGLLVTGVALAGGALVEKIGDFFNDVDLDAIAITDMSAQSIDSFYKNNCAYISDIAGN